GITVSLKLLEGERKIRIEIQDTGDGMTQEEIGKLFESFSRGTAGQRIWTEGAGLGLYIARKFIEMQKGRVWAESAGKERGSTFVVELPAGV
ncbi:MAG: ATP-binding protein, partial [Candidatus Wildermuthbacteria bacterium]|nr:ATP-binding protein [Candidatus Wildermuthbacteria bacterium]